MFLSFFQSVFKSSAVSTALAKINNDFFANTNIYSFNAGDLYFDEASLQKNSSLDDERRLYIWVSQIARYFKVGTDIKGTNSKENTSILISKFLKEINTLKDSAKKFLCTDEHALNCLILTLLLSNNKNDWDSTLGVIRQYNTSSPAVLAQLEWFYDFVFNSASPLSCEQLPFSDQPVSPVLKFMISAQYYLQNPNSPFSELTHLELPFTEHSTKLEILVALIQQGIIATQFTKHPFVHDLQNELKQIFRVEFQNIEKDPSIKKSLKKPEDRLFLEYFIIDSLNNIKQLEQEEQLVGLSQVIRFFSMKTLEFYKKTKDSSCLLVQKLFAVGKYTEAYMLHDDVIQFVSHSDKEMIDARIALYCVCCRLEQWLSGSAPTLKFNSMEEPYIEKFKKSKLDFKMGALANEQLLRLAKKIVQQFAQAQNKTSQDECKNYYNNLIKRYLSEAQQKTISKLFASSLKNKAKELSDVATTHQPPKNKIISAQQIQKLSEAQKELPSTLSPTPVVVPTLPEKPTMLHKTSAVSVQEKAPDLVPVTSVVQVPNPIATKNSKTVGSHPPKTTPPKITSQNTKKNKQEKAVLSAPSSKPKQPVVKPVAEQTHPVKAPAKTSLKKKNNKVTTPIPVVILPQSPEALSEKNEENTPLKTLEQTQLTPHSFFTVEQSVVSLTRAKIPQELLLLMDELRKEFPKAAFYLTGAAPGNILEDIEPNDYDLLVLNISLFELQDALTRKKISSEQRSVKYPILYCPLTPKISIDFSVKFLASTQTPQDLLKSDFLARDFNLNALYMEFTEQNQFPIFSYSNALAKRAEKKIVDVLDSPIETLKQDPIRLFRLAKLMISYPNYSLDTSVKKALIELQGQWPNIMNTYLLQDKANRFRMNHALRKLFSKCSMEAINEAFVKLHVLPLFSGNSKTLSDTACSRIPKTLPKEYHCFSWILANSLQYLEEKKQVYCPLLTSVVLTPNESACLRFVALKVNNNIVDMQAFDMINEPALVELLQEFHLIEPSAKPTL
ncbi:hypothetical protein J2N86_06865 [Legionella lytica]|uniref:Poly(A) polymerase I n=1 Tax=Legionella lytica TaxID=96232 RepID=A0ABY4YBM3_9GAMM|nr:hypothetical protein [Legionella lytica]USQ15010.1 hypothetical protein J2N86_06865 [Legionella lytica]